MITTQQANAQILRLSGLPGYPAAPEAQEELIETMRETAQDTTHADRMVRAWQQKSRFAPAPYDLYEIARETTKSTHQGPRRSCELCDGTGWCAGYVLRTWSEKGDFIQVSDERISEERYCELRGKLPGLGVQEVYVVVEKCGCRSSI